MAGDHNSGGPLPPDYPSGQTRGNPQRPAHPLARPLLTTDLSADIAGLQSEEGWRHGRHTAKTLVKEPGLRIVLIAMPAGTRMGEHRAPGALSIHTLVGEVSLHVLGETIGLPAGRLLALEPHVAHDVEARAESAILLTVAWPVRPPADAPGQGEPA